MPEKNCSQSNKLILSKAKSTASLFEEYATEARAKTTTTASDNKDITTSSHSHSNAMTGAV
jgi:hypothetical protein